MNREMNVAVFNDTCERFKETALAEAIHKSLEKQKIYEEDEVLKSLGPVYKKKATVTVSDKKSFEAALKYRGMKVCVHNFASFTNPGGGVANGSSAQEESLCRVSTLYPLLSDGKMMSEFYWRHKARLRNGEVNATYNDDAIYTPDVVVFKDDSRMQMLPESQRMSLDVITIAAPNLRPNPNNKWNPEPSKAIAVKPMELLAIHKKRAKRLFSIAKENGAEVLLLGAFGCGAFQNPPEVVARAYKEVLAEFEYDFDTVEFAVYCPKREQTVNPSGNNYAVFKRVLGNRK